MLLSIFALFIYIVVFAGAAIFNRLNNDQK